MENGGVVTVKQEAFYWREWRVVLQTNPAANRHDLHRRALGCDKSHKNFTNQDFDAVLAVFRSLSRPDDLNSQLRQQEMERTRLIYAIVKCGFPENYLKKICLDRWGKWDWRNLPESQLRQFKITLQNRARTRLSRQSLGEDGSQGMDVTAGAPKSQPKLADCPF